MGTDFEMAGDTLSLLESDPEMLDNVLEVLFENCVTPVARSDHHDLLAHHPPTCALTPRQVWAMID